MNPILASRRRQGAYLLLWLPVALLLLGLLHWVGDYSLLASAAIALPLALAYAFMALGIYYLCRSRPVHLSDVPQLVGAHLMAAALSVSLWVFGGSLWVGLLELPGALPRGHGGYLRATPTLFGVGLLLFLLCSALYYVFLAYEASREAEHRALELQVLSREAELKNLRAQIHPHFLFNALNSINALVTRDPEGARRVCLLLGDFLRQSLTWGARESVSLDEELGLAEKLLGVEVVRFGARLRYEIQAAPDVRALRVPPLLLQPLVENAVTHGIAHLLEGGQIRLEAACEGERLRLAILNPRDPQAPRSRGAGVGLDNVRRRLEAQYGTEAHCQVEATPHSFAVRLELPATRTPAPII